MNRTMHCVRSAAPSHLVAPAALHPYPPQHSHPTLIPPCHPTRNFRLRTQSTPQFSASPSSRQQPARRLRAFSVSRFGSWRRATVLRLPCRLLFVSPTGTNLLELTSVEATPLRHGVLSASASCTVCVLGVQATSQHRAGPPWLLLLLDQIPNVSLLLLENLIVSLLLVLTATVITFLNVRVLYSTEYSCS
jgi:hypothetical protein